jgi:glycerate kinase
MKKVVIAIDSFKGSLSSQEVANAFEQGFRTHFPECEIRKVCIADGGEGTVEALVDTLGGEYIEAEVCDPLHRPIKARYGIIDNGKTAVMEMSAASGLPLLTIEERNPLLTSTYGTGEMISDALQRGCRRILMGIGGSATNDAGTGMLRALGYRFLDKEGQELSGGGEILAHIASIDGSHVSDIVKECEFVVACDVKNPLYGESGAAHIFAPQKGADAEMVEQLDKGLRNFARVVEEYNGEKIADMEGAGAAGGLGGGFKALLGARLERGIDMVLAAMNFDAIIEGSDIVVTGEGRIDYQTVMGKAPSGVLKAATKQGIPTIAIGGGIAWCEELRKSGFSTIVAVTPEGMPLEVAMQKDVARENVRRTAERIAESLTHK